jgi:hypothetical protein
LSRPFCSSILFVLSLASVSYVLSVPCPFRPSFLSRPFRSVSPFFLPVSVVVSVPSVRPFLPFIQLSPFLPSSLSRPSVPSVRSVRPFWSFALSSFRPFVLSSFRPFVLLCVLASFRPFVLLCVLASFRPFVLSSFRPSFRPFVLSPFRLFLLSSFSPPPLLLPFFSFRSVSYFNLPPSHPILFLSLSS